MKKNITKNIMLMAVVGIMASGNLAMAQTAKPSNSGTGTKGPLLADKVAGKLMVKADVGYVYNFAGGWEKTKTDGGASLGDNTSAGAGGFGYGASLGWTSKTGFGLAADYMGFNHKWNGAGTGVNAGSNYNYDAAYHVMTVVPSYRFKLDSADHWGLRLGMGVGFSISDVKWKANGTPSNAAQSGGTRVAGGASYISVKQVDPIAGIGNGGPQSTDFGIAESCKTTNAAGACTTWNPVGPGGDCVTSNITLLTIGTGAPGNRFPADMVFTDSKWWDDRSQLSASRCATRSGGGSGSTGFTDAQIGEAFKHWETIRVVDTYTPIARGVWTKAITTESGLGLLAPYYDRLEGGTVVGNTLFVPVTVWNHFFRTIADGDAARPGWIRNMVGLDYTYLKNPGLIAQVSFDYASAADNVTFSYSDYTGAAGLTVNNTAITKQMMISTFGGAITFADVPYATWSTAVGNASQLGTMLANINTWGTSFARGAADPVVNVPHSVYSQITDATQKSTLLSLKSNGKVDLDVPYATWSTAAGNASQLGTMLDNISAWGTSFARSASQLVVNVPHSVYSQITNATQKSTLLSLRTNGKVDLDVPYATWSTAATGNASTLSGLLNTINTWSASFARGAADNVVNVPYSVYSQITDATQKSTLIWLKGNAATPTGVKLALTDVDYNTWSAAAQTTTGLQTLLTAMNNYNMGVTKTASNAVVTIPYSVYTALTNAERTQLQTAINGGALAGKVQYEAVPASAWAPNGVPNINFGATPPTLPFSGTLNNATLTNQTATANGLKTLLDNINTVKTSKGITPTLAADVTTQVIPYSVYSSATLNDADRGKLQKAIADIFGTKMQYGAVPDSVWAASGAPTLGFTGAGVTAPSLSYAPLSQSTLASKTQDATNLKSLLNNIKAVTDKGGTLAVDQSIPAAIGIPYSVYSQVTDPVQKATLDNLVAKSNNKIVLGASGAAATAAAPDTSPGGAAKDDAGFVLAPQMALEYDNGLFHFDVNVKYLHAMKDVKYYGSDASGSADATKSSGDITYTSKAGPLALFVGVGLGVNF
ncbi:MAG: hypothetical protein QM529_07490 [Hydrotalea sp.]|nr:hypothetical protein [Hydrotalea sp.]